MLVSFKLALSHFSPAAVFTHAASSDAGLVGGSCHRQLFQHGQVAGSLLLCVAVNVRTMHRVSQHFSQLASCEFVAAEGCGSLGHPGRWDKCSGVCLKTAGVSGRVV